VSEVDQVTNVFMSCVLPSENVPVARNSWLEAGAISALDGVMASDARVAELTVSTVVPAWLVLPKLKVAFIFVVPALTPTAVGAVLAIVAIAVLLELHTTDLVMSWVEESLNTPVAVKLWAAPIGIFGLLGEINTEVIVALLTVRDVEPEMPPKVAVIVVMPWVKAEASALPDPTLATDGVEDVQLAKNVTSRVLPSLKLPFAAS